MVELARQIRMEFDFLHEARVMDAVGRNLQVPRSFPLLFLQRTLACMHACMQDNAGQARMMDAC